MPADSLVYNTGRVCDVLCLFKQYSPLATVETLFILFIEFNSGTIKIELDNEMRTVQPELVSVMVEDLLTTTTITIIIIIIIICISIPRVYEIIVAR